MRRLLSLSSLVALIALGPAPSFSQPDTLAPQISISSSRGRLPNIDPLVDPDTFFLVGANQTRDLPLDIVSISLRGPIFLFAGCCMSGNSRAAFTVVPNQVLIPGATIEPSTALSAWLATRPQEGTSARFAKAVLRASSPASGIPDDAGTFLAYVDGIVRQPLLVRSRTIIVFSVVST